MTISLANSLKFRHIVNDALDTFDDTYFNDEEFRGAFNYGFSMKFKRSDEVIFQCKMVEVGGVSGAPEVYYNYDDGNGWQKLSDMSLAGNYAGGDISFWEYAVDMTTFAGKDLVWLKIEYDQVTGYDGWISEPFTFIDEVAPNYLKLEFFNYENAFEVDYSNDITHLLWIEAQLKNYEPGGEVSVYENDYESTKIKDVVRRFLVFQTLPMPRYLAEMVRVAMAEDSFFINEVEFVADRLPQIQNNASNLVILTAVLQQRNVLGLNTDDIGYDCDSTSSTMGVYNVTESDAAGQGSFTVPEGYALAFVFIERSSGAGTTPVLKVGSSVAGDDILYNKTLNDAKTEEAIARYWVEDVSSSWTLYWDVSGASAKMNLYFTFVTAKELTT